MIPTNTIPKDPIGFLRQRGIPITQETESAFLTKSEHEFDHIQIPILTFLEEIHQLTPENAVAVLIGNFSSLVDTEFFLYKLLPCTPTARANVIPALPYILRNIQEPRAAILAALCLAQKTLTPQLMRFVLELDSNSAKQLGIGIGKLLCDQISQSNSRMIPDSKLAKLWGSLQTNKQDTLVRKCYAILWRNPEAALTSIPKTGLPQELAARSLFFVKELAP